MSFVEKVGHCYVSRIQGFDGHRNDSWYSVSVGPVVARTQLSEEEAFEYAKSLSLKLNDNDVKLLHKIRNKPMRTCSFGHSGSGVPEPKVRKLYDLDLVEVSLGPVGKGFRKFVNIPLRSP